MNRMLLAVVFALGPMAAEKLTLVEALEATERLNPDLQAARLRILESASRVETVKSAYLPQANLDVSGTYQTNNLQGIGLIVPGFPSRVGPFRTFNARPLVSQTVLDLGLLDSIRASRIRANQSKIQAESVREDLQVAVVQLYLQALQSDSRRTAASERLKTAETILRQAHDRESAGTGNKLDVARAEQQLESERGILIASTRELEVLKSQLLRAIGSPQRDVELVVPAVTMNDIAATTTARQDLKALEAGLDAAKLDIRAAERQRLPKLGATGDWGVFGAGPDQSVSTYNVGAFLRIPLWTGRRIESEVAQAKLQAQQVEKRISSLRLQIEQELRQALIESEQAALAMQSAERGRLSASQALELSRLRMDAGLTTAVDVSVAQSAFADADDRVIRARYDGFLAKARLAWASGDVRKAFRE